MNRTSVFTISIFLIATSVFAESPQDKLAAAIENDDGAQAATAVRFGARANGMIDGDSYLAVAAANGNATIVRLLLDNKADVNWHKSGGWTALMAAVDNGHLEVVRLLINRGANVNAQTMMGRSALMRAAYHGRLEITQLLISSRANVNQVDEAQNSALMFAAQKGDYGIVRILLNSAADKNLKNSKGKTALRFATEGLKNPDTDPEEKESYNKVIALLQGKTVKPDANEAGR